MEERMTAIEFKDSSEKIKPTVPETEKRTNDIEVKLAGMTLTDPWPGWKHRTSSPMGLADGGGAVRTTGPWVGGKGIGKWDPAKLEQRSRTIKFTNFPRDTPQKDIK